MSGIVFDSSVYINAFRLGDESVFFLRSFEDDDGQLPVWLSVVVLEELYAGAIERRTQRLLNRIERSFDLLNRVLVPSKWDWIETGKILHHFGARYGFEQIGKGRITNDTLIATSTARKGFTLLTSNLKDFERIRSFRTFKLKLL